MKTHIHKTKKPLFILLLLFVCTFLLTCEKIDRDNPWDAKADLDPNSWAPQNLEIELISITERKLTWQYGDHNIEGFKIEREQGDGNWIPMDEPMPIEARSWTDETVKPDTTLIYTYRLFAFAGNNTSASQNVAIAATFPPPSNLKVIEITDVSYELSWQVNSIGEEGFRIDRRTDQGAWTIPYGEVEQSMTSFIDTNVFLGKSSIALEYRVYAFYGDYISAYTYEETEASLTAPSNLQITQNNLTSVTLNWNDNNTSASGFRVERKYTTSKNHVQNVVSQKIPTHLPFDSHNQSRSQPVKSDDWQVIGTTTNNVFEDNDFQLNIQVHYRVSAYAGDYDSGYTENSFDASLTAPSDVQLEALSDVSYLLSWQYEGLDGISGFRIERKLDNHPWEFVYQGTDLSTTSFTDENVFAGKTAVNLSYRIHAWYQSYESEKVVVEATAEITAPSNLQITQLNLTSVTLNWDDNNTSSSGFRVERKYTASKNHAQNVVSQRTPTHLPFDSHDKSRSQPVKSDDWQEIGVTTENVFEDNDFQLNTQVHYRVSALAGNYHSDYAYSSFDSSIPRPTNLEITINSISSVSLSWQDNSIGEEGFKIDRKLGDDDWEIGYASVSANETSYTDNDVDLDGNHYLYRLYAHYGNYHSDYYEAEYIPLEVTTNEVTNISSTSATSGGLVVGSHVVSLGIAYGSSPNPDLSGNTVPAGSGAGGFTAEMIGLTPETNYHVRAYATNEVGVVYGQNISFETLFPCGNNITFMYKGQQVTYGTVSRGSLCWMDRNLGASRVPTSSTDLQGYGDLFQWGRLDDGHQNSTSGTTSTLSNTNVPGHGNFITVDSSPWDWRSPQNNNLWQGTDGINNPCPPGWRVPTEAELNAERLSWTPNNSSGAYSSTLKWPVGGNRNNVGMLILVGSHGNVWSTSVNGSNARSLGFSSTGAGMGSYIRVSGLSVRCVMGSVRMEDD